MNLEGKNHPIEKRIECYADMAKAFRNNTIWHLNSFYNRGVRMLFRDIKEHELQQEAESEKE